MTQIWPLRFRQTADGLLFVDEAGAWFVSDEEFLERYASKTLTTSDFEFLRRGGHAFEAENDLHYSAFLRRWSGRHAAPRNKISYLILVPTLRCNLTCSYCQVSRAAIGASGYDWSEKTLADALAFIEKHGGDDLKIEFQGGEPLVRLDLLEKVREFCRAHFKRATFVVCSNFQEVNQQAWGFFASDDTFLSTSIDGDVATHTLQRTGDASLTSQFFTNVQSFVDRFGSDRISALPTIDITASISQSADRHIPGAWYSLDIPPTHQLSGVRSKA